MSSFLFSSAVFIFASFCSFTKKDMSAYLHHLLFEYLGSYRPRREKTCLRRLSNNTGADQPAHPRRLIGAFVIRLTESIIRNLITGEISIF